MSHASSLSTLWSVSSQTKSVYTSHASAAKSVHRVERKLGSFHPVPCRSKEECCSGPQPGEVCMVPRSEIPQPSSRGLSFKM